MFSAKQNSHYKKKTYFCSQYAVKVEIISKTTKLLETYRKQQNCLKVKFAEKTKKTYGSI